MFAFLEDVDDESDNEQDAHNRPDESLTWHGLSFRWLIDKRLLPDQDLSQTALTRDFLTDDDVTFSSTEETPAL